MRSDTIKMAKTRVIWKLVSWVVYFACFIGVSWMPSSAAAKRVALVIGNSAYEYATELTNPKNDAEDMSQKLAGLADIGVRGPGFRSCLAYPK